MDQRVQRHVLPSTSSSLNASIQPASYVRDRRPLQVTTGNLQSNSYDAAVHQDGDKSRSRASSRASSPGSPPYLAGGGSLEEQADQWKNVERDLEALEKDVTQYRQYRAKQRRDNGRDGEGVWNDRVERAFQKGLAKYPPLGRTKVPWRNGKSYGRNELIAAYIVRKTGEWRSRKQVSSHIQVLKAKMKGDKNWMALVTPTADQNPEVLKRLAAGVSSSGTKLGTSGSLLITSVQNVVRPINFDMWVEPPRAAHEESSIERSVHTYTTLANSNPLPAVKLDSVDHWRSTFPHLASLHHHGAVDCEITLLETTINMNTSSPLAGCELGTRFEVFASSAYAGHSWHSITNVYSPGNVVQNRYDPVPHAEKGFNGAIKLRPRFASSFWAHKFVELGVKQNMWEDRSDKRLAEAKARSYMRGISAMQELYATPNSEVIERRPKRVALFLWKFSKTRPGETSGQTQWRNLIPPPSRILTNSAPGATLPQSGLATGANSLPSAPPTLDWSVLDDGQTASALEDVSAIEQHSSSFYDSSFNAPTSQDTQLSGNHLVPENSSHNTPRAQSHSYYSTYPNEVPQAEMHPFIGNDFVPSLFPQDPATNIIDNYQDQSQHSHQEPRHQQHTSGRQNAVNSDGNNSDKYGSTTATPTAPVVTSSMSHRQDSTTTASGYYDDQWNDYAAAISGGRASHFDPHSWTQPLQRSQSSQHDSNPPSSRVSPQYQQPHQHQPRTQWQPRPQYPPQALASHQLPSLPRHDSFLRNDEKYVPAPW